MDRVCCDLKFEGRPVKLHPFMLTGTDGPLTAACNLRGGDFMLELVTDDDYAQRLLAFITRFTLTRQRDFLAYWGDDCKLGNSRADDCCQMIGVDTYINKIMPHHRTLYESVGSDVPRGLHMCGNVQHLLPTIRRELNVTSFDTGFPIDHGRLRRELGPDVEIQGGTEIALLLGATPQQVFNRTRDILLSGVSEGGRFILREGNNLLPNCPRQNLEAMYAACLEFGSCERSQTIGAKGVRHAVHCSS